MWHWRHSSESLFASAAVTRNYTLCLLIAYNSGFPIFCFVLYVKAHKCHGNPLHNSSQFQLLINRTEEINTVQAKRASADKTVENLRISGLAMTTKFIALPEFPLEIASLKVHWKDNKFSFLKQDCFK